MKENKNIDERQSVYRHDAPNLGRLCTQHLKLALGPEAHYLQGDLIDRPDTRTA